MKSDTTAVLDRAFRKVDSLADRGAAAHGMVVEEMYRRMAAAFWALLEQRGCPMQMVELAVLSNNTQRPM